MAEPSDQRIWHYFWDAPHRPLFLGAFVCAFLTVGWWPLGVRLGLSLPAFDPIILWHVHELIFGFAGAAVGGYLLTALPSWTGRAPVKGAPLILLALFWAAARIATAFADQLPLLLPVSLNAGYFLFLASILLNQSAKTGAKRGILFGTAVLVIGSVQCVFLISALSGPIWIAYALAQNVVIGFALLMTVIGTRAIPAFTNNWLARTEQPAKPITEATRSSKLAHMLLVAALFGKIIGQDYAAHIALILASISLFHTMSGWRTTKAFADPLLAALHMGYLWVPLGLGFVGAIKFLPIAYPPSDAIHILTIGAMAGLIMAISGRAASHQPSGVMKANGYFVAGVSLIWITTLIRLSAPLFPQQSGEILMAAAIIWCVAWASFILGYTPALRGPARRPVLSGSKHEA